ncbi:hypothetical protein H112_02943 [Trichophyton rubrum D6]|uniref:Uncharacterized protein n=3 Tax=Trichophyton rubrum TaxID=5551 RepID=A0A178EVP2_TRIRU|nr:uncharacterized protein TERG_05565 [Trichophyton rubrum CBS 118892]EZF24551.1 hypothetical protein H100_02948 [Trichophyton rubrum MR850]EZF43678.1 hypothetical protein H102_02941 [Trichophyton rubrum CBS 100081]EZF54300.1 hypothetical protein H103_02955 [Trichophyton rubrum CBS 288.86]EZF64919.1 hypothetical protein H104_02934 [Trichophyton rubrum CBS 289.86]EZF86212.1 hypothetical protein H110_02956 [Trichophyton rubrum MR1448]EZF97146.1 hypothetical protein H113_02953 [Trichophyton rubr
MARPSQESDRGRSEYSDRRASEGYGQATPNSNRGGSLDQTPSPSSDYLLQRRHRKQGSSTFRLESPTGPPNSNSPRGGVSRRGKDFIRHQSDDSELVIPKRSSQQPRQLHTPKPSIGSSPLSNVVSHEENDQRDAPYTPDSQSRVHHRQSPSVGLDTDPAQIVNLALSLSDSRNRVSSARTVSSGTQRTRLSSPMAHSRPQAIQSPRISEIETPARRPSTSLGTVDLRYGATHYGEVQLSHATLARAEKAKQHFELFENYLRLLPHLPPLPSPGDALGRHQTNRGYQEDTPGGRQYNPLQYLRNRKIRYRERQAIDSEAAGWGDVEKVSEWVDSIVNIPDLHLMEPDEYIDLPEFKPSASRIDPDDKSDRKLTHTKSGEVLRRRPRMDWATTPLDLLADIVWYEQNGNKAKVEDRHGKKLFPHGVVTRHHTEPSASQVESLGSMEQSNAQVDAGSELDDIQYLSTPTPAGGRSQQNAERGRLRHRLAHSINLTPNHSRSRKQSKSPVKKRPRTSSESSRHSYGSNNSGSWRRISKAKTRESGDNGKNLGRNAAVLDTGRPVTPNQGSLDTENIHKNHLRIPNTPENTLLPNPDFESNPHMSPRHEYSASNSSLASDGGINGSRDIPNQGNNSPFQTPGPRGFFPNMSISLSPLRGRSTSPSRRNPFHLGHSRKPSRQKQGQILDFTESQGDLGTLSHRRTTSNLSPPGSPSGPEGQKTPIFRRADSSPAKNTRSSGQQDWKRLLKGTRIAELVGSEVSRVGDLIRKKDNFSHSRRSSASSLSEYVDADTKIPTEDDSFCSPAQKVDSDNSKVHQGQLPDSTSSPQTRPLNDKDDVAEDKMTTETRDPDSNMGLTSQDISTSMSLDEITKNWTPRYIPCSGRVSKRDISFARARLLSSGIKALEICRYAESSSAPFADSWLNDPVKFNNIGPYILSSGAAALRARRTVTEFDERVIAYNKTIKDFTKVKAPPMQSRIRNLEIQISSTLTLRIIPLTTRAETLAGELGTKCTLPVKRLENILNKGLRKRNRRIRSIITLLSAIFEWMLMGVFWVVWISVMIWKLIRLLAFGAFRGVRWVLWL